MSIKRGYLVKGDGRIKMTWNVVADSSPYPECLTLDPNDIVIEDTETNLDDWWAFQHNPNAYYFADGMRVAKSVMTITLSPDTVPADGVTVATVSGIPTGTLATVNGQAATVDDGLLALTFDLAGDYEVVLSHPHYLPPNPRVIVHAT